MKKIYLFCSAGMSTSMLASKMQSVADAHNVPVKVAAHPHNKIGEIIATDRPDCILLGPQVKYMLNMLAEKAAPQGIPVKAIDMADYGMQRGDKVLDYALSLIAATH